MDSNLDYKVIYNADSKWKSLYSWSLQELSEDGAQAGNDYIPWDASLYFTAHKVTYRQNIGAGFRLLGGGNPVDGTLRERIFIRAELRPEGRRRDSVRYSMLGTKREIKDFVLFIQRTDKADDVEGCRLSGNVEYTTEVDFRDLTVGDELQVFLQLRPTRFDDLVSRILSGSIDELQLALTNVRGFYGEWSPSITTDKIKVLADRKDQSVELPEGIEVPVLGQVEEFEIGLLRSFALAAGAPEQVSPDNDYEDNESAAVPPPPPPVAITSIELERIGSHIRLLLAGATFLLLLLLLKNT